MAKPERLIWSWKRFWLGALVATVAPQLIGISVVVGVMLAELAYEYFSFPSGLGVRGFPRTPISEVFKTIGAAAAGISMATIMPTLIFATVLSAVFCKQSWSRKVWPAVRFGALLTTLIYFGVFGLFVGSMLLSNGDGPWSDGEEFLDAAIIFGALWLAPLTAGCLTAWILHRFFKILDRRQLLAADSGQASSD